MGVEIEGSTLPEELPPLPRGWRYEALGDLVDERGVCYGIVQPGSADARGVPIVRVNNIRDGRIDTTNILRVSPGVESKFGRSRLRGGEVLLTLVGTLGEVAVVPHDLKGWNVARAVGVIPVREDPGAQWVAVCLRSGFIQRCIRAWATTTVQATFNLRDLAKLPIPVPPTRQRGGITSVLGALDDKIDLNRRMCQTLEEMARALFKSWFVDFDPVRAKMEGRDPGLPKEIADLFPSRLVDSELGPIPEGWAAQPLDEVADFLNGLALQKHPPRDGVATLPVLKIAQLKRGDTSGADQCSAEVPAPYRVVDGDLIFSWSGSLEVALWTGGAAALNQHLFKVTSGRFPKWCLYQWVCQHLPEFRQIAADKATTMGHIQRRHLSAARVAVPPEDVLRFADSALGMMTERILAARTESRTLAALRDTLLPKLISGELRVPITLGAAQEVAA